MVNKVAYCSGSKNLILPITNRTTEKAKCTAYNGRFCESGGVFPQKHLCEFASASPAQAFVSPRPRQAAGTLYASGRECCEDDKSTESKV